MLRFSSGGGNKFLFLGAPEGGNISGWLLVCGESELYQDPSGR